MISYRVAQNILFSGTARLKALFQSSQKPTCKIVARTFIQSQYLKAVALRAFELAFAMSGKEAVYH